MSQRLPRFYAFGPFRADTRRRRLLRDGEPVQLTPKAFDILLVLVEGRGGVVEKDELMRRVWPDQFVEESNLSVNMSALRRALGETKGENQYVATVPRRGYRFVAEVSELGEEGDGAAPAAPAAPAERAAPAQAGPAADPAAGPAPDPAAAEAAAIDAARVHVFARAVEPAPPPDPAPNNLPVELTPFVGRQSEAMAVERLLRREDVRLVTLTGAGGSGKTRLGLHVASRLLGEFPEGVFFVALEPVGDPQLVASTVAQTLGVKESGGTSLMETLKTYLRERRALLFLDNFEQVVSAAPALAELLASTRRLKMLVTSRAVLRLSGEHEFRVPPLLLPDLRGLPRAPELVQYSAVELFVQRAAAARSDFLLSERNARAVAEICVHLDGLPLAIELAAARVRLLPPQAMLARLSAPFKLLTGGARNLPKRQQTMRSAIAWSYDLLDEAGKCLFRRLSVFAGGATIEAAGAVCSEASGSAEDIQDGVSSLVENSLLRQVEQPGGEPRFVMLETIREYGIERLAADGELDGARRRHAAFFLKLAEEADPELGGERLEFWLEQLEQEHDNLRAGLRWSLEAGEEETSLRLVRSLWWFWYLHGYYQEGRDWMSRVLAATSPAASQYRARALVGAGVLAFLQCEYAPAQELLDAGLEMSRQTSDREGTAMALQVLGSVARERGEYERAVARHQESLALWRELEDKRGIARSLNLLGFAAWLHGDFRETRECCETALSLFREQGDKEGVVWALLNLAHIAHYAGEGARAAELGGEALALSREVGFKEGIAWSLHLLGDAARARGDAGEAAGLLRGSLELHHELGDRWRVASVLESLGALGHEAGDDEGAARMLGAAEALREAVGAALAPVEWPVRERCAEGLRRSLGERRAESLMAEGRAAPLAEVIASALGRKGGDAGPGDAGLPS
jgi:non-specific serine/threonine protein kinase